MAAAIGVLIVAAAWWIGPDLFGATSTEQQRSTVTATVVKPTSCTKPGARETVTFQWHGKKRKGVLTSCGHDRDEQITVAVPVDASGGTIQVSSVTGSSGYSALRGPVGLLLLAASCLAGGVYAFLVVRGPRVRLAGV